MAQEVKTRFAPSPTGYLHIGGARTALFSWLYARHTRGKFVLRIEDTDIRRSTKEASQQILDAMKWLGLAWDEGPFYQSERMEIYLSYINKLLDEGKAYWCECTPDILEGKRKKAIKEGRKPKYDGTCRDKGLGPGPGRVVRFATPKTGITFFDDIIKGRIATDNDELDDLIILRSDGIPTYNLTVVVDDATMGITHIIRGDDHVNNTPRQILIYDALGVTPPVFAHVPMILGSDKTRLSKRHGATSVMAYKDMGYLPEAMVNYLVRLSWSHGDQEIFSINELIDLFDLKDVGKSAAVFNPEKLLWLNHHYIKQGDIVRLSKLAIPFIKAQGYDATNMAYIQKVVTDIRERAKTLIDMIDFGDFYFKEIDINGIPKDIKDKFLHPDMIPAFKSLIDEFDAIDTSDRKQVEDAFRRVLKSCNIKLKAIAQPVRLALTGKLVSPGIFEIISTLGKNKVVSRLKNAITYMEENS
ncbi:MAG: glutamate--tRNA ligase [Deltaproteobacteria bacterium]|nr:glutamate--tRNA ligase [Deltaproteobacteria bacterium]